MDASSEGLNKMKTELCPVCGYEPQIVRERPFRWRCSCVVMKNGKNVIKAVYGLTRGQARRRWNRAVRTYRLREAEKQSAEFKWIVSWREWIGGFAIYFQHEHFNEKDAQREMKAKKRLRSKYVEVYMRKEKNTNGK